uniref:Acetylornithine/succinyldiaminopimelate aminotransferase (ACOAT) (DapATase) (Succinyldiaminopimelate transferase) ) n=1 Tax=Ganoderma boninense TaxID=34458 RepID=A0A5K1K2P6_9APHY|nr:Acetylornithine/succinyldiaminopimelate aminotransferase (ACOAT) (DapATase) (Succinyldiaminopimelate transferase) (EC (EC [Ganoderma boninense]
MLGLVKLHVVVSSLLLIAIGAPAPQVHIPSQPVGSPAGMPSLPIPWHTYEPPAPPGETTVPEVGPFMPAGGVGTDTTPLYRPLSDFDFQSLTLALYQEYIELDLFEYGLAKFPATSEFEAAGLTADDRHLIQFMADQEVAHARLLTNIIGKGVAAQRCTYTYPFASVRDFLDFCQKLTRFGESGVYGFLAHLASRAAANLLLQSIATEARQQMAFRQLEGLFPTPVFFEPAISQSMAWTLLAPYVASCPPDNTRIAWQNFPALTILNNPNASTLYTLQANGPGITHDRAPPLSAPGRVVRLQWESPGLPVGPDRSYTTHTSARGAPAYVAWVSQLNTTYTALTLAGDSEHEGTTVQPFDSAISGTMFVAVVDAPTYVTPHNVSVLNEHIVAGPAVYQAS